MISKVERRKGLLALGQSQAESTGAAGPLAISDIRAFAVPPSGTASSYVVLQVRTQSGLIRRLAAMAETYYVAVSPWHDAGPIATAAALHAAASIPNFFIVQLPNAGAGSATPRDGFFELPKGPGLGVEVDEKALERNQIV